MTTKIQKNEWENDNNLNEKQKGLNNYVICDICKKETSRDYDAHRDYCDRCGADITYQ